MVLYSGSINNLQTIHVCGKVTRIVGLIIEGHCPHASIGSLCEITPLDNSQIIQAEIVGFKESRALLMPLGELRGLGPGSTIRVVKHSASIKVGPNLLGRVINAMEEPIDGQPAPLLEEEKAIYSLPPGPMERQNISEPLDLGIRAINVFSLVVWDNAWGSWQVPVLGKVYFLA